MEKPVIRYTYNAEADVESVNLVINSLQTTMPEYDILPTHWNVEEKAIALILFIAESGLDEPMWFALRNALQLGSKILPIHTHKQASNPAIIADLKPGLFWKEPNRTIDAIEQAIRKTAPVALRE